MLGRVVLPLALISIAGCTSAAQPAPARGVPAAVASPRVDLPGTGATGSPSAPDSTAAPAAAAIPSSFALVDLAFTSTGQGWIAGADCPPATPGCSVELRLTHDGGRSYEPVSPVLGSLPPGGNGLPRLHVVFTDSRTGWVTGLPRLLRSVDGGHTWQDDGLGSATDLAPSGTSVWALADGGLYTSSDRGGSWGFAGLHVAPTSQYSAQLELVRLSARDGLIVDAPLSETVPASLVATRDGWQSWTRHPLPCRAGEGPPPVASVTLAAIWVACSGEPGAGNQGKEIDVSTDRGTSWQTRSTAEYRLSDTSPAHSVALGNLGTPGYVGALTVRQDGRLFLTLDHRGVVESGDGTSWLDVPDLPQEGSDGLRTDFVDSRQGWTAVGYGNPGPVWSTSDGGAHWLNLGAP